MTVPRAYYNEVDKFAAAWLRELIAHRVIAPGEVDERSIIDVQPSDLVGFTQCHFFAGIGVWSYALRRAGWSDATRVWTGSCPCQPFSAAGKGLAERDERHLWPEWFRLIDACRPPVVFGEQVASREGLRWLSGESTPLQALRDREAVVGILRELQRRAPVDVRGLHHATEATDGPSRRTSLALQELARLEAWLRPSGDSEAPGENAAVAVRSGPEGHPTSDRTRRLRGDGDPVRPVETALMECAVTGSDSAGRWLHLDEREGGSLFAECDGERVGTAEDRGDRVGDYGAAASRKRGIVALFRRAIEDPPRWPRKRSVCSDLEGAGYAFGAADLCAAGVGAPHIRQRLYFVADAGRDGARQLARELSRDEGEHEVWAAHGDHPSVAGGAAGGVADADGRGLACRAARLHGRRPGAGGGETDGRHAGGAPRNDADGRRSAGELDLSAGSGRTRGRRQPEHGEPRSAGETRDLGDASSRGCGERRDATQPRGGGHAHRAVLTGFWADAEWIDCADGKARPVEPGTFPLVTGAPARVGRLRGYGNALNAEVARAFIEAYCDVRGR